MAITGTSGTMVRSAKLALDASLAEVKRSGNALATGKRYSSFFQNPTNCTIGELMQGNINNASTKAEINSQVFTMIETTMNGCQSLMNISQQLQQIIYTAQAPYMTQETLDTTLKPTYVELVQQLTSSADSLGFLNQPLGNGQGGHPVAGTVSTSSLGGRSISTASQLTIKESIECTIADDSGVTINGGTAEALTIESTTNSTITSKISPEQFYCDTEGNIKICNATLNLNRFLIKGTTATDGAVIDLKCQIDIAIPKGSYKMIDKTLVMNDNTPLTITVQPKTLIVSNLTPSTSTNPITIIEGLDKLVSGKITTTITATVNDPSTLSDVTTYDKISGGVSAKSGFTAYSASLNEYTFYIPNLNPADAVSPKDGTKVLGAVSTMDISAYSGKVKPNQLPSIDNIDSINSALECVDAYISFLLNVQGQLSATAEGLTVATEGILQLTESLEVSQTAFVGADIPTESEKLAKAKGNAQVCAAVISQMCQLYGIINSISESALRS